ncbi:MAG: hypothetical protein GC154_19760 [bacterium]|nr:hypothetical protein [bacterium]
MRRNTVLLSLALLMGIYSSAYSQGIFDKTADWPQIGNAKAAGSASFANGVYAMKGNGNDVWGNADEGFFLYTEKEGSWSISGKVKWVDTTAQDWAKVGVMIRDAGDDPGSAHYWAMLRGAAMGDQSGAQWRPEADAASLGYDFRDSAGALVPDPGTGLYLRVTRLADINYYYSEWSTDGTTWKMGNYVNIPMGTSVAYGLTITNHNDDALLAAANVSDVQITAAPVKGFRSITLEDPVYTPGVAIPVSITVGGSDGAITLTETPPAGWAISGISNGGTASGGKITWNLTGAATVSYTVTPNAGATGVGTFSGTAGGSNVLGASSISEPEPLGDFDNHLDVGGVGAPGSAEFAGGTYTVVGSGADIWGNADEFHFVYKKLTGDFSIEGTVYAYNDTGTNEWSKAGFMIRDNLTAGSSHMMAILRGSDLQFDSQWRTAQDTSSGNNALVPAGPENIRVTRVGYNVITSYQNPDTGEWVQDGSTVLHIDDPVYVGMVCTSHDDGLLAVGEFTNVKLTLNPYQVLKSVSAQLAIPGDAVKVTIKVNPRSGQSASLTLTEKYPAGYSISGLSATSGTPVDDGNGTISWPLSNATASQTLTYSVVVPQDAETGFFDLTGTYTAADGTSGPSGKYTITIDATTDLGIFQGHQDIGGPLAPGNIGFDGESWRVIGSGSDIWDAADHFHFLWLRAEGDFKMSIDAPYVGSFGDTPSSNDWQKMGIMARQSLDANSAYAYVCLRASDQAYMLQWRDSAGAGANWDEASSILQPIDWNDQYNPAAAGVNKPGLDVYTPGGTIILSREGDAFIQWFVYEGEEHYQFEHNVVMTDPIYVGIAVTSHEDGSLSQGIFKNPVFEGTSVGVKGWMLY